MASTATLGVSHGVNVSGDSGLPGTPVNMADLHRRVERLLANRDNNSNPVGMPTCDQEAIYANLVAPSTLLSCISFDQTGNRQNYQT